jgi:AraC-like DNA-binding protein
VPPPQQEQVASWIAGVDVGRIPAGAGPRTVTSAPDPATTLIVRFGTDVEALVAGPRRRALYHQGEPGPTCVQVRIAPGRARPLVGRALSDLTDRIVPLAIPGLADELTTLGPAPERFLDAAVVARLDELLAGWLAPTSAHDRARSQLVADATGLLRSVGVAAAARRLHVSERQLRNLFAQAVGLSPKQVAGIDRVRSVLDRGPLDGLAAAASGAGYYDQPHMTAEFRRLMGVPPAAFLAGHRPTPTLCARAG